MEPTSRARVTLLPSRAAAHSMLQWRTKMVSELLRRNHSDHAAHQSGIPRRGGRTQCDGIHPPAQRRSGRPAGADRWRGNADRVRRFRPGAASRRSGWRARRAWRSGSRRGAWHVVPPDVVPRRFVRGAGQSTARGVSVEGEVKNYVPVTPAMLKNPPDSDWLIFGRNCATATAR